MTRILGVDPGSWRTGYAIIDRGERGEMRDIRHGVIASAREQNLPERLSQIHRQLLEIIDDLRPQVAAVETAYYAKNPRSALVLGQARGAALVACAHAGLQIIELGPMQIKLAVTGAGRASKAQVQKMTQVLLGLPLPASPDAADALAAAMAAARILDGPMHAARLTPTPARKRSSRLAWTRALKGWSAPPSGA